MTSKTVRSIFLDRDGILNVYLPGAYVRCPGEMALIPGVASAIRLLNDRLIPVVVISNQQGVGKGVMSRDDLHAVQHAIEDALLSEAGATIDAWYYCTELAASNSGRRKPEPGMLFEAANDLGLDLSATAFIGDSQSDIAAGRSASVGATVLVLSGATRQDQAAMIQPRPDYIFDTLRDAVAWVLKEDRK